MSNNNRVNTRARRLSQERRDLEEYDPSSSCSSAEGARRSALEDARDLRLERRRSEQRPNAIQLAQEEADDLDAARFAGEEAYENIDDDEALPDDERRGRGAGRTWTFLEDIYSERDFKSWVTDEKLVRGNSNNSFGYPKTIRSTIYKCSLPGCRKIFKVKESIVEGVSTQHYVVEEETSTDHDHSLDGVPPVRGLSSQQKVVIDECLLHDQRAPKQVLFLFSYYSLFVHKG